LSVTTQLAWKCWFVLGVMALIYEDNTV